ncbi:alpha-L-rhamnosidase [Pedobacter westerhofensis]|uniref:Alpha-L-rhamnosidase n=1 Tax=Pedobacter westerhofensis TaxID=425512 RepID=A0A521ALC3_9SPHI|nr:glycosyl hydrolase [Pedobacter westerhofensis]SMO35607.1 alpha-L-rhamnosidase [Pedobacter westerhofensis]
MSKMLRHQRSVTGIILLIIALIRMPVHGQKIENSPLPPMFSAEARQSAKPWVFWYWIQAGVSKAGIRADLEAMKAAGIGGAYLMPIQGAAKPPVFAPATEQLSPAWWEMMRYAFQEAARLDLQIGMHVSDGFALAGGPWITPELSMQKVVSSQLTVRGAKQRGRSEQDPQQIKLPQPQSKENFYRDIAVYAFPAQEGSENSSGNLKPKVTTSLKVKTKEAEALSASTYSVDAKPVPAFKTDQPCWIQYEFDQPFTCRSITIRTGGNNYQAHRLFLAVSDDGKTFKPLGRLQPPRHGWQDTDADVTHSIIPVTAKFYRFTYDPAGSEPGAEDLDAAKWKPSLKLTGLELSSAPKINQFESKNGEIWRVSERSTAEQLPASSCVPAAQIISLSKNLSADGVLTWKVPPGKWTILRMGHTSTGHTNATGGGGAGLEVDKFNAAAIKLQFSSWYGEAIRQAGPELAKEVLRVFHVDSWECGSQNWSDVFPAEFKKRRGYDLLPWLPVISGIPVQSAEKSELVLYDIRKTIAELVADTFYQTLAELAKEKGVVFTAESVAPTMMSDGMLHYQKVDIPMGEFWLNSPTHDKPNDMLDAISGAHIYGKNIVQAEAFTTVRMAWNEHPGMLKTLQDRNYALGINKLVYHVFAHNPWADRKPGMTLDGVGLYFQRDQTWWKPGKAWVDYAARTQLWLQKGKPVTDIAVFTGEEYPRRALLPERLVKTLPGIIGEEAVKREEARLANIGQPLTESPAGVRHSANITDPQDWTDPLHGYAYDSFNPDVLMRATVKDGRVVFPSGANYALLVFPVGNPMDPAGTSLSSVLKSKVETLKKAGAKIYLTADEGAYQESSFEKLGIAADVLLKDDTGAEAKRIAWNHRRSNEEDIYFISNQEEHLRNISVSFRVMDKFPYIYDAVSDRILGVKKMTRAADRIIIPLRLEANAAVFVIFKDSKVHAEIYAADFKTLQALPSVWQVSFDPAYGGRKQPVLFKELADWSESTDSLIRYYSGTAVYRQSLQLNKIPAGKIWLDLGRTANIATVKVNGKEAGTLWTAPFRLDISGLLKKGENHIEIAVTNTWANRLIGDHRLPQAQRITQTTAPYRLDGLALQEAGLLGPVKLLTEQPPSW